MQATETIFTTYAQFCRTLWAPAVGADEGKDIVVMGYGLPGEWGEVADVLADGMPVTEKGRAHLIEEMGDVVYYWARIAGAYRLDVSTLIAGAGWSDPLQMANIETVAMTALRMTAATGRVVDVLKKDVRDGHLDRSLLVESMSKTITLWCQVCIQCGIDWRHVITANQAKVSGRRTASRPRIHP